jgi:hypothetical protein
VAWAVNQLSGSRPELRDELLQAGAALREAQERVVAGEAQRGDLRSVGERERAAVGRALEAVEALAEEAGAALSPVAIERARQTLHSVALDEDVRRDFEHHRLTTEHEAAGLGGPSPGAAPARAEKRGEDKRRRAELKAAEAEARKRERRRERAARDVEAAREAAERAQRELERATTRLSEAAGEAAAARQRVDALRDG